MSDKKPEKPEASVTEPIEELDKSGWVPQPQQNRAAPERDFEKEDQVVLIQDNGTSKVCVVEDHQLEGGRWKYKLRDAITQDSHAKGTYVPEHKLRHA